MISEEVKRELRKLLRIKSPSEEFMKAAGISSKIFADSVNETVNNPEFQKAVVKVKHRQELRYIAIKRKIDGKIRKARIRNGLM